MAKVELCRTRALGGHIYRCQGCNSELPVYNSCRDRHCPLCKGGRGGKWLEKTEELLLPGLSYFQVIFTLPSRLASFALGNRKQVFGLLMPAAWQALEELLGKRLGAKAAASLVLHTWNQRMEVHPHVHALVPGGFPSLDGQRWITPKHPKHKRRKKPYLCDVFEVSELFRQKFIAGLRRLYKKGELNFKLEYDATAAGFEYWISQLESQDWNVYIQGPPHGKSDPAQVAKYLTRYMTGGPIADSRMISYDGDEVWFWARSRQKSQGSGKQRREPYRLSARQFVHRWSQHILPAGFTKARSYGGYHNTQRSEYIELCRQLLPAVPAVAAPAPEESAAPELRCPRCEQPLVLYREIPRRSWGEILESEDRPDWYYAFRGWNDSKYKWYRDGY